EQLQGLALGVNSTGEASANRGHLALGAAGIAVVRCSVSLQVNRARARSAWSAGTTVLNGRPTTSPTSLRAPSLIQRNRPPTVSIRSGGELPTPRGCPRPRRHVLARRSVLHRDPRRARRGRREGRAARRGRRDAAVVAGLGRRRSHVPLREREQALPRPRHL